MSQALVEYWDHNADLRRDLENLWGEYLNVEKTVPLRIYGDGAEVTSDSTTFTSGLVLIGRPPRQQQCGTLFNDSGSHLPPQHNVDKIRAARPQARSIASKGARGLVSILRLCMRNTYYTDKKVAKTLLTVLAWSFKALSRCDKSMHHASTLST